VLSPFAIVVGAIWLLVHLYLARTLIRGRFFARHRPARVAAWLLVLALASLPTLVRFADPSNVAMARLGWIAFSFSAVAVALSLPFTVARWIRRTWARLRKRARMRDEVDGDRREFLGEVTRAGIVGTSATLTGVGYALATRVPPVRDVEIAIDGLPAELEGFHIVQLTDIHIGRTIRKEWLEAVVARANDLAPDIMAVTGDVVDGRVAMMSDQLRPLGGLRGRLGTYYVTGNHEYYWDGAAWVAEIERFGLRHLKNEHVVFERNGARIVVGGVTDHRTGARVAGHRSDPHAAIRGAPEGAIKVLLAHQPRSVYEASKAGWDVQLSGHTHGGQFFPYSTLIGLFQPYGHGLHHHDARTWIYVSRGTGYWGPPNRAGSSSEITSIRLRRA
jgi:predicted MPP superfamily phosphohydrolase